MIVAQGSYQKALKLVTSSLKDLGTQILNIFSSQSGIHSFNTYLVSDYYIRGNVLWEWMHLYQE